MSKGNRRGAGFKPEIKSTREVKNSLRKVKYRQQPITELSIDSMWNIRPKLNFQRRYVKGGNLLRCISQQAYHSSLSITSYNICNVKFNVLQLLAQSPNAQPEGLLLTLLHSSAAEFTI